MSTQTTTKYAADYAACQVKAAEALFPLLAAVDAIPNMSEAELEAFSKVMRAVNKAFGAIRTPFDAKLLARVESGTITLGPVSADGKKRTGIQPVRAPRAEDAAKPGRKAAAPKSAQERMATLMEVE